MPICVYLPEGYAITTSIAEAGVIFTAGETGTVVIRNEIRLPETGDGAENDILWADMIGLTDGIGADIFDMTASADRAEIAAYLRRFCEAFAEN